MLTSIKRFVSGIFSETYEKQELQKEISITNEFLTGTVIPSLKAVLDTIGKVSDKGELEKLLKNMGISVSHGLDNGFAQLLDYAKEIEDVYPTLEKLLDSEMPDFITDKSMTAKQAGFIGTLTNINSDVNYMTDVAIYALAFITNDKPSKILSMKLSKNADAFRRHYDIYAGSLDKVVKNIGKLSDVKVHDTEVFKVTAGFADKKFKLPVNGFRLNPIYHVRKMLIDLEMEYYEYLKTKRELLEAKIKEAELEEPSPALEKRIEYYQEKLDKIEYKIKKIEESA